MTIPLGTRFCLAHGYSKKVRPSHVLQKRHYFLQCKVNLKIVSIFLTLNWSQRRFGRQGLLMGGYLEGRHSFLLMLILAFIAFLHYIIWLYVTSILLMVGRSNGISSCRFQNPFFHPEILIKWGWDNTGIFSCKSIFDHMISGPHM